MEILKSDGVNVWVCVQLREAAEHNGCFDPGLRQGPLNLSK
jgi:hypothetical protein